MDEFLPIIHASELFAGVDESEIPVMLQCLDAKREAFPKDAFLLREGQITSSIGMVLSGSVLVVQEDIWGNRNILSRINPSQTFATAFACAPGAVLNVSVVADTPVTVLFLNVRRILTVCSSACTHHSKVVYNLLGDLAQKNLRFNEKLTHMGQRTTRAKLMSYFSMMARKKGSFEFEIPFSRQQMADYLGVERSGLSAELGKMQKEGLLEYNRNRIVLKKSDSNV